MKKLTLSVLVLSLLAVLGGISLYAALGSQDQNSPTATQKATSAVKKGAHKTKEAVESGASKAKGAVHHHHASNQNLTAQYARGVQDVSGTISMVDANQKVVVVTNSDGVPFDFKVTRATHIMVNGQKATLDELSNQTNKQASIKFRDGLQRGLLAQSIELSGS